MRFAPAFHVVFQVLAHDRVDGIDLPQMLFLPAVRYVIIHGNFFPHAESEEIHRVFMVLFRVFYKHFAAARVFPRLARQLFIFRAIERLPEFLRTGTIVDFELFFEIAAQKIYFKRFFFRRDGQGIQRRFHLRFGVRFRKFVMLADHADRGIHAVARG